MKEVLLDTETTGLSPVKDKIIEIACIEIDDHIPTGEKFHVFLNPEMEISQGAYETHGITREFLNDKPKFKDIAKEFQEFINEKKLIKDLKDTMYNANGIGLAAIQIGIPKRIVIVDVTKEDEKKNLHCLINLSLIHI